MPGKRIEQRPSLRSEGTPPSTTLVVRGGRDTRDKLRSHVRRTARAWSLDGEPLLGISVFAVLDEPLRHFFAAGSQRFGRSTFLPRVLWLIKVSTCCPLRSGRTSRLDYGEAMTRSWMSCCRPSVLDSTIPRTLEASPGEGRTEMYLVDIVADLNDEDETGYVWTFLDEARDPGQIQPGALVIAGDEEAAAVCQVVDLAPAGDGTIVHLRLLPGVVDDYRALVERAAAS